MAAASGTATNVRAEMWRRMVPLRANPRYNWWLGYSWCAAEPTVRLTERIHFVRQPAPKDAAELDPTETREWLDSLDYVLQSGGPVKVARLLRELTIHARQNGVKMPFTANTPYINSISADEQVPMPGSPDIERRIKSLVRWNALAMVVRANKADEGIGGHISTFASAATLYEVAFNHFFRGSDGDRGGDVVFFQGHASPGIYSRAYLEG